MRFVEAVIEATTILEDECKEIVDDLNKGVHECPPDALDRLDRLNRIIEALKAEPTDLHPTITSPAQVDLLLRNRIAYEPVENFAVVLMNTKNRVISAPIIAIGSANACLVDPKSIWKPALTQGASRIILVHNHPSGDTTPSREDKLVTNKAMKAGETLGIELVDHIILGNSYTSMKEAGYLY